MADTPAYTGQEDLDRWIKEQLDQAVHSLMESGDVENVVVEAKPAWVLPFEILLGKTRARGQAGQFVWFICGSVHTDYTDSSVASTPRDAIRHFALKWQLQAARQESEPAAGTEAERPEFEVPAPLLAEQAEALYMLVEEDKFWQS